MQVTDNNITLFKEKVILNGNRFKCSLIKFLGYFNLPVTCQSTLFKAFNTTDSF